MTTIGARRSEAPDPRRGLLVEVQALRAVAVVIVLGYHLWPARLPGGYVGVDVFFVISGFLIIGHLVREQQREGRFDLRAFYARRARRLLPAAFLVLAVTGVAIALLYRMRDWPQLFGELLGATLYVENWVLSAASVDYLALNTGVLSPVQHFWSLGVEEQFYLVWPILLIVGAAIAVRITGSRAAAVFGRSALVVMGVVLIASLAASIVLTLDNPAQAFFGTHVRAWEFAAGGLLSVARLERIRPAIASVLAWAGLAIIGASALLITSAMPFPGWLAIVPVLGTMCVIAAGAPAVRWAPSALYRLRPVQFLGDVSYGLYLWHWPILVLGAVLLARQPTGLEKLALASLAVGAAAFSLYFVENPVRSRPPLATRRPLWTAAAAMLATLALAVPFGVTAASASARLEAARIQLAAAATGDTGCLGAASLEPECDGVTIEGDIVPSTDLAPHDDVNRPECWTSISGVEVKVCSYGPENGVLRVALVGDSHANQYLAAVQRIAVDHDWHIDVMGKSGCIWTGAVQDNARSWVKDCQEWKGNLAEHLAATPYDLIITSASAESPVAAGQGQDVKEATVAGYVSAWSGPIADGATVVAIKDNPHARGDFLACIDRGAADAATRCALDQEAAFPFFDGLPFAVDRAPGSALVDMTDYFCIDGRCPPVIGGALVYQDPGHITATYARTMAEALYARIVEAMRGA